MKKIAPFLVLVLFSSSCSWKDKAPPVSVSAADPSRIAEANAGRDVGEPAPIEEAYEEPPWPEGVAATMDVIDVGTGLSILVRGPDFALLFDAGSKEDIGRKKRNRVLAFLKERHPDLEKIDHVVLSHPHKDHVNLMAEVIRRYDVKNVWDVGLLHGICPYRLFLRAVSEEEGISYRSAARGPGPLLIGFEEDRCRQEEMPEEEYLVEHGPKFGAGERVRLGEGAKMEFLYADPKGRNNPNRNSLVARLDIAGKRLLLMADAVAGPRMNPRWRPWRSSIEGRLLRTSRKKIRADLMVVGHHGSHTSSRTDFLDAVKAKKFIISVGRANFHGYVLPDPDVVAALEKRGEVYRTDARDDECLSSRRKVGKKEDGSVGGCDNIRIVVPAKKDAEIEVETYPEDL